MYFLLVGKEVRRQCREVVGPSIRVSLPPRSVKLEHHHRSAPLFRRSARCYPINGAVYRGASLKRCWTVPDVEGESERFPIKALRQYDGVRDALRKVLLQ